MSAGTSSSPGPPAQTSPQTPQRLLSCSAPLKPSRRVVLPLYLHGTVFGTGCKQTARVGEAEVQDLVVVFLQGLHFHAGDGVVEPLELVIPGDGSWNTSGDTRRVSVEGRDRPELNAHQPQNQPLTKRSLGCCWQCREQRWRQGPAAAVRPAELRVFPSSLPNPKHRKSSLLVHTQLPTALLLPKAAQALQETPRAELLPPKKSLAQDRAAVSAADVLQHNANTSIM